MLAQYSRVHGVRVSRGIVQLTPSCLPRVLRFSCFSFSLFSFCAPARWGSELPRTCGWRAPAESARPLTQHLPNPAGPALQYIPWLEWYFSLVFFIILLGSARGCPGSTCINLCGWKGVNHSLFLSPALLATDGGLARGYPG